MKTIFSCCFFIFLSTNLIAQSVDKSNSRKHVSDFNEKKFLMDAKKIHQNSNAQLLDIQNNYTKSLSYLEQPEQFTLSERAYETVPIALSDSLISFAYSEYNLLLFTISSDSGKTWSNPITVESGDFYINHLTGLKTNSGRIILIWLSFDYNYYTYELKMAYTDDLTTWYISTLNNNSEYFYSLNLTQTNDEKLWLCYSRYNGLNLDLYYITSTTNGITWSNENIFLSGPSDERDGTIVSGLSSELIAFYCDYSNGNSDIYKIVSTDGGISWSVSVSVLNSAFSESGPKVIKQPDNTLWLFYYIYNPTNLLSGYSQQDIQYVVSSDGGNTWGLPERFTFYSGDDYNQNVTLLFGKPFVSFASSRWSSYQYWAKIWYGLIGKTEDSNPPPSILDFTRTIMPGELSFILNAFVDDESGISDVKAEVFVNSVSQGLVQMYDDGLHGDFEANDYIWGINIGPFNLGDYVSIIISITDISNNNVNINPINGQFLINPIHNAGDLILSLYDNSQLAEFGNSYGTSAYWHGYDYLFLGGLWIGTDISGEKRVMNLDYYQEDWFKTQGSIITMASGISDQDCNIFYDDWNVPISPIGLSVHQKSYQWGMQGHDDFIIFEYIIKNRVYENINDLYTSLWLDPDICSQTITNDDLGGYDSERGMIYMYDPQNNPTGYLGLRLLTETPSTAYLYTYSDPQTDEERYQYMTNGIMPNPTTPADYRTLLTSQPFTLAPADSHIVAFGLVMGNGLEDLQANADTMKALFQRYIIVDVNDKKVNPLPTAFNLSQNYPNPFNPTTKISWQSPVGSWQTLKVFDVLGNEIATLVDEYKPAGSYEVEWNASHYPSGVYFCQLKAGNFIVTKKMILLK